MYLLLSSDSDPSGYPTDTCTRAPRNARKGVHVGRRGGEEEREIREHSGEIRLVRPFLKPGFSSKRDFFMLRGRKSVHGSIHYS